MARTEGARDVGVGVGVGVAGEACTLYVPTPVTRSPLKF